MFLCLPIYFFPLICSLLCYEVLLLPRPHNFLCWTLLADSFHRLLCRFSGPKEDIIGALHAAQLFSHLLSINTMIPSTTASLRASKECLALTSKFPASSHTSGIPILQCQRPNALVPPRSSLLGRFGRAQT